MPSVDNFKDDKAVANTVSSGSQNPNGPMKTSYSTSDEPRLSLVTYGLSDAMQGMALYKPSGVTYDVYNRNLSGEMQDIGVEALYTKRNDKLNAYDVFVHDPDPATLGNIGANAQGTSTAQSPAAVSPGGPANAGPPNAMGFVFPGEGGKDKWKISQHWANDKGGHPGVDLICTDGNTAGKQMIAVKDGTVHQWPNNKFTGAGNMIQIDHGAGLWTMYMHMSSLVAPDGGQVKAGDQIGVVGSTGQSTGAHIHFEVHVGVTGGLIRFSGTDGNTNPEPYIGF